jgi:hypothetical protein
VSESSQLPLDPPMSPPWILPGQPHNERPDRYRGGWASGTPARGVVPLRGEEPAMPGKQGAGGDREDLTPVAPGNQPGQGCEPEPVGGLIADRSGQLAAQDRVLVPQHQQFRLLRRLATQEHRWNSQQLPSHLVEQGHDHARHDPSELTAPRSPAAMTFRAAPGQTSSQVSATALFWNPTRSVPTSRCAGGPR